METVLSIILDVAMIALAVWLWRTIKQRIHDEKVIREYQQEMNRLRQQKYAASTNVPKENNIRPVRNEKPKAHYFENGFDKGEAGEWAIEYALKKALPSDIYILRNLYIPYRDIVSEIDLILLHETGIYIFESKNYNGWIFGNRNSKDWTQIFKGGKKNKFYNPIRQNETHINAIVAELKLPKDQRPKSYIVFGENCELKAVPKSGKDIVVCQQQDLIPIIEKRIEETPQIYGREVLKYMNAHLHQFEKY